MNKNIINNERAKHGTPGSAREPEVHAENASLSEFQARKNDRARMRRLAMLEKLGKVRVRLLSRILEQEVDRIATRNNVHLKVIK